MLKLVGLENDQNIGDRVRPDGCVAEAVDLDRELLLDRGAHALGDGAGLRRVVIDVGVIAQIRDGLRGFLGHRTALPAGLQWYSASLHSRYPQVDSASDCWASFSCVRHPRESGDLGTLAHCPGPLGPRFRG